jgi:hypothetical protein
MAAGLCRPHSVATSLVPHARQEKFFPTHVASRSRFSDAELFEALRRTGAFPEMQSAEPAPRTPIPPHRPPPSSAEQAAEALRRVPAADPPYDLSSAHQGRGTTSTAPPPHTVQASWIPGIGTAQAQEMPPEGGPPEEAAPEEENRRGEPVGSWSRELARAEYFSLVRQIHEIDPSNGQLSEVRRPDDEYTPTIARLTELKYELSGLREEAANARFYDRSLEEYRELARDADHGGKITPNSLEERTVALELEQAGKLARPIRRGPRQTDYIDANKQTWDVKSYHSGVRPRFNIDKAIESLRKEINKGNRIMLNTSHLSPRDAAALREAVKLKGWDEKVLWWSSGELPAGGPAKGGGK